MTLKELADEFGVPKQVDQNHEWKEITQELKMIVLRRAAEVADLILAVADNGGYRCNSQKRGFTFGKERQSSRSPVSRADAIEGTVR